MITYDFLSEGQFPLIYECLVEAFADYHLDMSYMNKQSMYNRMKKNGVDFESSPGAFVDGKLVGLTLIGIDTRDNVKSAFDAATGIIPDFRGKGIARALFEFAIPKLERLGVEQFLLEVIQVNEAAIKAYKKSGFETARELDCFQMDVNDFKRPASASLPVTVRSVEKEILAGFEPHLDWEPSWENSLSSVARIPDQLLLYGAFKDETCVGIAAYYPGLKWITTLIVDRAFRRQGIGSQLITHLIDNLPSGTETVKIVNILRTDRGMIDFAEGLGFKLFVSQFEMAWRVKTK